MTQQTARPLVAPTPHPSRAEALVRSWRQRNSPRLRLALLAGLGILTGVVAGLAPGRGAPVLAAAWTLALCPFAELLAVRTGAVDWPDRRSALGRPAARLGAIAWFGGILGASWALPGSILPGPVLAAVGAGLLVLAVIHELAPVSEGWRFAALVCIVAILVQSDPARVDGFAHGPIPSPWDAVVASAWIVTVAWSFRRLAAMEGLVPALAGVTSTGLGLLAFGSGDAAAGWLGLTIGASSCAFLAAQLRAAGPVGILLGRTGGLLAGLLLGAWGAGIEGVSGHPSRAPTPALLVLALPVAIAAWSGLRPADAGELPAAIETLLRSRSRAVILLALLAAWTMLGAVPVPMRGPAGLLWPLVPLAVALAVLHLLAGARSAVDRRHRRERG